MIGVARTVHRILLLAYPRAWRERDGDELTAIFVARLADVRARGRAHAFILALWLAMDVVMSGGIERVRVLHRRVWWPRSTGPLTGHIRPRSLLMSRDAVIADVRLAVRQMRRSPGFAATAMLTLALGIGANTAIVSVVHAVLLRPLPYADPDRLVAIWSDNTRESNASYPVSPANFEAFAQSTSFEAVEAMYSFLINLQVRSGDALEAATSSSMTPGMFTMLGRAALHGRTLREGDEQAVVLSHDFWMRRFGGTRDAIGQSLVFAGTPQPFIIVGVMPADFVFPYRSMLAPSGFTRATSADIWRLLTPVSEPRMRNASGQANRTLHMLGVVGRLRPDVTIERARAELRAMADARAAELPETNRGFGVTVRPLLAQTVGAVRPALLLLLGGVGLLLLMTCLNVANVLLARLTGRHRDTAVRAALGASRGRLAQQSLVESFVLAVGGGALGAAVVLAGRGALLALAPSTLPRLGESAGFVPLLVSTVGLTLAAGFLVGLVPAFASSQTNAEEAVRITRSAPASSARRRVRAGLVIAQLALATTLTVAGGVLLRSFAHVLDVDPGFTAQGVLTFQVRAPEQTQAAALVAFYDQLQERLEALPGVRHAGGSTRIPLGSTQVTTQLNVEGRSVLPAERPEVEMRRALGDYFQAMNIPVLEGRVFTAADRTASIGLAVINSALAERVFRDEGALGRRVQMGPNPNAAWLTIIGVVGNVKHTTLEEAPRPEIYISHYQGPPVSPFMAVQTSGDPAALTPAIRRTLAELGADPPFNVRTMDELRIESVGERKFVLVLVGLFGVLALALAGVGIYAVVALVVSERTAELGVRLALGATPRGLLGLVVGQALRLAIAGAALGVLGAVAVTQAIAAQLYGVSPVDPPTFATVALVLVAIAAAAALVPARRAMRVDPADALRT